MAEIPKSIPLCRIDEIDNPGAKGFEFGEGVERLELVAVRQNDLIRVFINTCPHQGTPLETFPDRFLTRDNKFLLCSTHGAEFRLNDGFCLKGPCVGQYLQRVDTRIENGVLTACFF